MTTSSSRHRQFGPIVFALGLVLAFGGAAFGQDQIEKGKIYQDSYPLAMESDLYCDIFLWEGALPVVRIVGAERAGEKVQFSDGDAFYVDKGSGDGLEMGQVFQAVSIRDEDIEGRGRLSQRVARVRIVRLEDRRAVASVDKACRPVLLGDYLVPYEPKETIQGRDLGFSNDLDPNAGIHAAIIYLDTENVIGGTGMWGIIDAGLNEGLQPGQQLTVFRHTGRDLPREAIANVVIIDAQNRSATVKILSARDAVRIGDEVQTK